MADNSLTPAVEHLIDTVTLTWIVPQSAPDLALLMPTVLDRGSGQILGHLPTRHPATAELKRRPRAQLLYLGPNDYVPNSVVGIDDWAPTWHFVSARLDMDMTVDDSLTDRALTATVAHLEESWTTARLGERYQKLAARVTGFAASVHQAHPKLRLGQDEAQEVRDRIDAGRADAPLARWAQDWRT